VASAYGGKSMAKSENSINVNKASRDQWLNGPNSMAWRKRSCGSSVSIKRKYQGESISIDDIIMAALARRRSGVK